jgi:CheY-like chemotaxis protein
MGGRSLEESPIILVVEDDPPIQMIIEDALVDGGFEPAIAPSGEEAVTLLKGHKGKYHALVADISLLGRLDGWEVAKRAREIDPAFPVLYITGAHADRWPSQGVPEQRSSDEAICASATCHCREPDRAGQCCCSSSSSSERRMGSGSHELQRDRIFP